LERAIGDVTPTTTQLYQRDIMRKNIRLGFVAALAALAVSAASASAAVPAWFDGADRNRDGQVSWNEYQRGSGFTVLDENGDGSITKSEEFGDVYRTSSWVQVASFDTNRSGAVTLREYTAQLRAIFDAHDLNGDGVLSGREAEDSRRTRFSGDRRDGSRDFGGRDFAGRDFGGRDFAGHAAAQAARR
jgi:hypothetical protein